MAFLIIEEPIEKIIENLTNDIMVLEQSYSIKTSEALLITINKAKDKLRCVKVYQDLVSKRSDYEQFKHLRWKSVEGYITRCRALVKEIKGVDFDRGSMLFRIRIRVDGKQKYLGAVENLDHATEILETYAVN